MICNSILEGGVAQGDPRGSGQDWFRFDFFFCLFIVLLSCAILYYDYFIVVQLSVMFDNRAMGTGKPCIRPKYGVLVVVFRFELTKPDLTSTFL